MNKEYKKLNLAVDQLIKTKTPQELAVGFLRYEKLRTLSPRRFKILDDKNMRGVMAFDEMVDDLIEGTFVF